MDKIPGRNPVLEALRAGRPMDKLLIAGQRGLEPIISLAKKAGIPMERVDKAQLDRLVPGINHQGVVALIPERDYASLEDIFARAAERAEAPFVLLLDGLQDPQNLGSILRSAEAGGVHGIIIPKHRAVGLTTGAVKAAAGAAEYVPVVQVTNLVRTMEELKGRGLWLAGAEADGELLYFQADLKGPLGLVIGGEGKGLSRLVRENCDFTLRLPLQGALNSLNAGVAAGILIFEVVRQKYACD
ncbi:MAG: 23S rRNA (guanosine(2251)-2'-O)-methyltransferase RlmB [Limnochordia bacterium]|jgi:23S rRNA (guanosine2251-2'-O)-methyltransferase